MSLEDIDRFKFYTDLYSNILDDFPLRDECNVLDADFDKSRASIITKLSVSFIDMLYNPDCVNDYQNAPKLIRGLDEQFAFNSLFQFVFSAAKDYCLKLNQLLL